MAMVLGSPDEAAEQIEAYAALGIDEFCYGGNYGLDPARTRRSLELFVERVMPRFESRREAGCERHGGCRLPAVDATLERSPDVGRRSVALKEAPDSGDLVCAGGSRSCERDTRMTGQDGNADRDACAPGQDGNAGEMPASPGRTT